MATINQINGCYERGHFFNRLGKVAEDRSPVSLTLSWVDIVDFANTINNPFGHTVGDKALAVSGWAIRTYFHNPEDPVSEPLVGSWGGDEFVCVTPCEDALSQDHYLFRESLSYYVHDQTGQNRVRLNLKQLRNNMEATGSQHVMGIYSALRKIVEAGVDGIEYRYETAVADINGGSQARRAVDQFVREYSKKGNARQQSRE